ncbi:ammonia-dependent NAD(+) synthetase [Ectopseudomonas oleovorans]|uniref:NH(3)-dependent NAD(+) synthetase n=1 Tax=Ectopseudomonas oleovorans TaxID=301 RepID=A0A3D9EWE0_ECTOL|nr:ammonia-dependent NAD(+) synthetase [Pseudomonas oleovorans]RED07226.1 NH(3)-dependent NAD(+) synthetase [Pseudomonas oleovorans]
MTEALQRDIIQALQVPEHFDPAEEAERRIQFLKDYLLNSRQESYVLGISGGVDSSTAGRLAQLAVERAREESSNARLRFIAMRLPYGVQRDEADAQRALQFIQPDETHTVNIKPASDAMLASVREARVAFDDELHEDFTLGNIKARQRMIAQYAVAGARRGLVIGTDHAAEALMGFYTKFGDGACDLTPLHGLNKRRVRAVAEWLGAPNELVHKVPTADLESLSPGKADEDAFGITYAEIDDFLEGKAVSPATLEIILNTYRRSAHKRDLPYTPYQ